MCWNRQLHPISSGKLQVLSSSLVSTIVSVYSQVILFTDTHQTRTYRLMNHQPSCGHKHLGRQGYTVPLLRAQVLYKENFMARYDSAVQDAFRTDILYCTSPQRCFAGAGANVLLLYNINDFSFHVLWWAIQKSAPMLVKDYWNIWVTSFGTTKREPLDIFLYHTAAEATVKFHSGRPTPNPFAGKTSYMCHLVTRVPGTPALCMWSTDQNTPLNNTTANQVGRPGN